MREEARDDGRKGRSPADYNGVSGERLGVRKKKRVLFTGLCVKGWFDEGRRALNWECV